MADPRKRILLVDDDPDMHEAIKLMLEPEGYWVDCCSTGPDGLKQLERNRPDLILLDIMLSTPSEGFHLAYQIKQDESLRSIPIIMISAIGKTMGMDYAKEIGSDYLQADLFLEKPLETAKLRAAVKEALGRARPAAK